MDHNLIEYLPEFIQEYQEIKEIMAAEQVDVEASWDAVTNALNDQFVVDATETGISRWEKILSIVPMTTNTLDERKFRILARLNEQLPYTEEKLNEMLTSLCGENGYVLRVRPDEYTVLVKLAVANTVNYQSVIDMLDKVLPANLLRTVMLFNSHKIISGFTHAQLSAYTHDQLRQELLV